MIWPAQTVVHILSIICSLDPDDVIMHNEPSGLQNTSAISETSLSPTMYATSLPVSLLPCFKMPLKNYCNSFASLLNRFAASRLRGRMTACTTQVPGVYARFEY